MIRDGMTVLKAAIEAVPAVKYALGIAGVMAAAAIGRGFFRSTVASLESASAMLLLMVILVVISYASTLSTALRAPAMAFVWFVIALFCVCSLMTATSVFLDWPKRFSDLLSVPAAGPGGTAVKRPEALVFKGSIQSDSGHPLAGVVVTSVDCDKRTVTNEKGVFLLQFSKVPDRPCRLVFEKDGYSTYTTDIDVNDDDSHLYRLPDK